MADDTEERQLDEFGFPIPTPEELAAELAKTDQVIRLSGAAQALENQLPSASPSQTTLRMPTSSGRMYLITPPGPVAYPPPYGMMFPKNPPYEDLSRSLEPESPVTSSEIPYEDLSRSLEPEQSVTSRDIPPPASLNLPVSSGRMYMGPAMTPAQETAFHALQSPVSQNLMPPPTPEAAEGAAARVAYAGRTFGGGGPYDPAMERFRAQQAIQNAIAKGTPADVAFRMYGQDIFQMGSYKPMTEFQRLSTAQRQQQLDQASKAQKEREKRLEEKDKPKLQNDPEFRANMKRDEAIQKNLDALDLVPELTDVQKEKQRSFLRERNRLRLDREKLAAKYATPTEKAATKPTLEGQYKVGARYGNMRYKGGDPSLASSWQKVQ